LELGSTAFGEFLSPCHKGLLDLTLAFFPQQYKKFGFTPVDWVHDYYKDENDDALLMHCAMDKVKL